MTYQVLNLPCDEKRGWLEKMVFHGIVFNMSWEDPEMDRQSLGVGPEHTVISITSAGCNPLNFLCQNPRRLISIDSNPAQTALMELKLAAIKKLDHGCFFDIFAARKPYRISEVYDQELRPQLSDATRKYWDKNLHMVAGGIYNYGRMGLFCKILRFYLREIARLDWSRVDEFFDCESLEDQARFYHENVGPRIWTRGTAGLIRFKPFMYLAGVHPRQFKLVDGRHDIYDYVKERVEYALTKVPLYNNYFLSMAVTGKFRGRHVPPYLLEENFETLRRNLDRVLIVNGWLGPFLDTQPAGSIDRFNLLDIFDWMTDTVFDQTMASVRRAAAPGARIIYRSGSYRLDPPPSLAPHVERHDELARRLLAQDRSATYGSFYVLSLKNGKA